MDDFSERIFEGKEWKLIILSAKNEFIRHFYIDIGKKKFLKKKFEIFWKHGKERFFFQHTDSSGGRTLKINKISQHPQEKS